MSYALLFFFFFFFPLLGLQYILVFYNSSPGPERRKVIICKSKKHENARHTLAGFHWMDFIGMDSIGQMSVAHWPHYLIAPRYTADWKPELAFYESLLLPAAACPCLQNSSHPIVRTTQYCSRRRQTGLVRRAPGPKSPSKFFFWGVLHLTG